MLEVTNLTSGYAGLTVVRELSLHVAAGELVALLGPNGAGKTTTLSTLFGVLTPMGGEIRVGGSSVVGRQPHRAASAGIGYVPEGRALAPSLTVNENLRLVDKWKLDPYELFPELAPMRSRRVGLLSGGEQQMLAVARAVIGKPKLLLVDELSFGLAPLVVDRLLLQLRAMADQSAMAVLLVEQHVRHALEHADRAYVMSRGQLVLERPARDLRADPSLLAACYLGHVDDAA